MFYIHQVSHWFKRIKIHSRPSIFWFKLIMKEDSNFLEWGIRRMRFVILIMRLILRGNKSLRKMKRKRILILMKDIYKILEKKRINSVFDYFIAF